VPPGGVSRLVIYLSICTKGTSWAVHPVWQKRYTVGMSRSPLKRFRRGRHDRGRSIR